MLKINDSVEFSRTSAAVSLVLGALCFLAASLVEPAWASGERAYLAEVAAAANRYQASGVLNALGYTASVFGLVGVVHLLRGRRVTLGQLDGEEGARTQRFVICHNPEQGDRDAAVRANLVAHLKQLIEGSDSWTTRRRDELVGSLKTKPGLRRYLRRTPPGCCGSTTARSSERPTWTASGCCAPPTSPSPPDDLAAAYKQLRDDRGYGLPLVTTDLESRTWWPATHRAGESSRPTPTPARSSGG